MLHPDAPSAVYLRRLWGAQEALILRDEVHRQIMDAFPFMVDDTGEPVAGPTDPAEAWPFLEAVHRFFVQRVQELIAGRAVLSFCSGYGGCEASLMTSTT
jgi:hypothetical protein